MTIDKGTKISLYAVGAALPFIVGGILWLSSVASDAKEAKSEVQSLRVLVEETHDTVLIIREQINLMSRGK